MAKAERIARKNEVKYQVFSRFTDELIIENDNLTQPNARRQEFTPDEQSQFRFMDEHNLTDTMGIGVYFVVNRSPDE